MNDEEKIISPDDILLQQNEEDVPAYEPEKIKLTVDDLTNGLKNYLNPENEKQQEQLIKDRKEDKPHLGYFFSEAQYFYRDKLAKEVADKKAEKNPNIVKLGERKYIDIETGKNVYAGIGTNEITEQALNGLIEAGYGIGQLVTIPLDLAFDTNLTSKIDNLYEKIKFEDPEDIYGQITKSLVEYGVPIGVIGKASKPLRLFLKSKASKINNKVLRYGTKAALSIGYNAGSFGVAEFIVGNKGDTINSVKYENEEGLTGKDLAVARINNKLRFGFEGTKLGAAFGVLGRAVPLGVRFGLKTTGTAFNVGARVANKTVFNPAAKIISKVDPGIIPAVSNAIRTGSQYAVEKLLVNPIARGLKVGMAGALPTLKYKNEGKIPPFDEWRLFSTTDSNPLRARLKKIDNFLSVFRKEYKTPTAIYDAEEKSLLRIKGENRIVAKYLDDLEKRSYDLAKSQEQFFNNNTSSPLTQEYTLDLVEQYLKNQIKINKLPKELQDSAKNLKIHLDSTKSEFLNLLPKGDLKDLLTNNIGSYLRKSFAVITNPLYEPSAEVLANASKAGVQIIKKNKDMKEEALAMFPNLKAEEAYYNFSEALMKNIIRNFKSVDKDPIQLINEVSKNILRSDKLLLTGEELPKVFRQLLGEEKNLRSSVLQTVTDLITQTSNKKLYDEIADIGLKSGWLKTGKGIIESDLQPIVKLPGLGLLDSKLNKLYANGEIAMALQGSKGIMDNLLQSDLYRSLLQFKTMVQFGKTGLSPETQVRNVVSTPVFPLSWGWIGGKGTINDSFKIVYNDIYGAGKNFNTSAFIEEVGKGIKLGYLDESVEVQELMAVVKKLQSAKVNTTDQFINTLLKTDLIKKATQTYQGGDNVWKHYAFKWNQSHLSDLFKGDLKELIKQQELITGKKYNPISYVTGKTKTYDDAVDEFATWYVRSLMPTYSQVPEIVRNLRLIPVGNFISWPAEILRLSGAGIRTALREASSDNIGVRQMGLRKLMGMTTTMGGAGYVIDKVARNYTGWTDEMMEAYKRSFAADYDKNSNLAPVAPIKDSIVKIVNSSYADVYDFIKKPIRAGLGELGKIKKPSDIDDFVLSAIIKAGGEIIEPFVSSTLALEPVIDTLPTKYGGRGGRTKNNNRIYSTTDDSDTQVKKSIAHIIKTAIPGLLVTFDKYGNIIYDLYKDRGQPDTAADKLISLLSGNKIQRIDLLKELDRKAGEFAPKLKGELTASEPFYSTKDWQSRGPKVIANELRQIQKEDFKVQQEILQLAEDAKKLNIPIYEIEKSLTSRFKNKNLVSNILYSKQFTPYKHYKSLFEKKYETISRDERLAGRPAPNYNFIYPIGEIATVEADHIGLDLTKDYDEQMKEKEERRLKLLRGEVPVQPNVQISQTPTRPVTPPLPTQPQPVAVTPTAAPTLNNGLTQSEMALLSPSEQAIRLKQRGIA